MFQKFFLRAMLSKQLSGMPQAERERVLNAIEANPDFFTGLVNSISERVKSGQSQQSAIMATLTEHKAQLEAILKP